MTEQKARIKFAYYSTTWHPGMAAEGLAASATPVTADEYVEAMHGRLYCPVCRTALTRTPRDKPFFKNQRAACFAHLPSNSNVPCDLKSSKPEGMRFNSEEAAAEAIANEELVLVSGFLDAHPEVPDAVGEYDQSQVESIDGPLSQVPISRHRGQIFRLPTKVATVTGICRRFDQNLYRYYVFPGMSNAMRLADVLHDIATVTHETDSPNLYYGKILSSRTMGRNPQPHNIRMTRLECHADVPDFYLKLEDRHQQEKGISDDSVGRFVLFWGKVSVSGIGLAVARLGWGEFALLPTKYEPLLPG